MIFAEFHLIMWMFKNILILFISKWFCSVKGNSIFIYQNTNQIKGKSLNSRSLICPCRGFLPWIYAYNKQTNKQNNLMHAEYQIYKKNKGPNKRAMLKSSRNHPSSASLEKLSSMKLAPGAKKAGTAALTQAHSWAPSKRFHSTLSTYNRNHRKRKVMRWETVSANGGTDRGVISKINKQPEQQQQNPPTA